jgi:thioredoxin-dependent peroxiredoxin
MLRTIVTSAIAAVTGLSRALVSRARGRDAERIVLGRGDLAPDFELPASDGRSYRLSDSRGREAVVIAWFPKAFTGGCTIECRSIGASQAELGRYRARVFGASVDRPETNRAFAASMGIAYPILSDVTGAVARRYGVLGPSGFPSRWTFYIGDDGRILEIDRRVLASSHGRDVATRLEALQIPNL